MRHDLDKNFEHWIAECARRWNKPLEEAAFGMNLAEIENRSEFYPNVRDALLGTPFDFSQFAREAKNCWVLKQQFDATRFGRFANNRSASQAVKDLMHEFPIDSKKAAKRINDFISRAIKIGISTQSGPDQAGAAQLASLILTSLFPKRFVDFRRNRWARLGENLKYPIPQSKMTYGEWLVWAGQFAKAISTTKTYMNLWRRNEWPYSEPLWVIAGLCWKKPKFHDHPAINTDTDLTWYTEGEKRERWHLELETRRNPAVIRKAKEQARENDPFLHCQICGFSFKETYGNRGDRFIEGHHKQPLGSLNKRTRTRIEDIAMVCSNCHRMLHRGGRTLSINELSALLQEFD